MPDIKHGKIFPDHIHHRINRSLTYNGQPFSFRFITKRVAIALGECLANGNKIIARIEPFRNRADIFTKRLAITQIGRAGEDIDLSAGVINVILSRDIIAGKFQEAGKRIAKYRAARWDAAIKAFQEALRLNPKDKLSEIYIERCETLKASPPDGEWNGVWVMEEK